VIDKTKVRVGQEQADMPSQCSVENLGHINIEAVAVLWLINELLSKSIDGR